MIREEYLAIPYKQTDAHPALHPENREFSFGARRPTVLIVEDDEFLRRLLHTSLERRGYAVVSVAGGHAALERFDQQEFDIILLDVVMPQIDGFEVCRRLRMRSDVPIVMMTGLSHTDDILRGFELGADEFIEKPFVLGEVDAWLQAQLRRMRWSQLRHSSGTKDWIRR